MYLKARRCGDGLLGVGGFDKIKTPVVAAKAVASAKRRENSRMVRSLLRVRATNYRRMAGEATAQ